MQTLTEEQLKQKYGDQAVSKFDALDSNRFGTTLTSTEPVISKVNDFLGLRGATKTFGKALNTFGIGVPDNVSQEFVETPTAKEVGGALLQTGSVIGGTLLGGPATLAGKAAVGAGLGYAYDVGQDLIENKSALQTATPGLATAVGGAIPFAGPVLGAIKKPASKAVNATVNAMTNTIPDSTVVQGAKQTVTDLAERVPRFVGRVSEATKEQAIKAQRINTSTPAVAQALKVDLPESLVQTVPKADKATKQAFKQVLDIADTPKTTLGQKSNPAIVGGELASKQYDVIEKQRKTIGTAIGEATKKLSKDAAVDMRPAYDQLDNLLKEQGVTPIYGTKGVQLDFSKSNLAPKQRQVVKDLYNLATEAGDTLSPYEVHKKDQLFSAIQREAKADQVADIIIELGDGQKTDLFRAFRDVYSNQLDTLGPEIKGLNSKYRNVVTLIDDIENSIFKTPDFEITRTTDPAEFAKVNLRRIFGEAQSSPVYEAIADEMDAVSRQLGYANASPKEVAAFAQEIRKLYPDVIPSAGQQGIITNAFDAVTRVLGAGKADTRDQQKALRMLLDETSS